MGFCAMAQDYPESLEGQELCLQYRADTWEVFTNLQVDKVTFRRANNFDPNRYVMEGFMGWYTQTYMLADPVVTYDPAEGRIYIESGQEIVTRYDLDWALCNMADEENMNTLPIIFQLNADGVFEHVSKGTYEGNPYVSIGMVLVAEIPADPIYGTEEELGMLYLFRDPSFHPFNGHMDYAFVAQNGQQYRNTCYVDTEVHGDNLIMHNWSNTGFDYNVFFTIDKEAGTLTATNQVCMYDPDMMGECTLSEATANGAPVLTGGEYVLQGSFTTEIIDGVAQTVARFPIWGCFDDRDRNFFVPTTDTVLYVGYDITSKKSGADSVEMQEDLAPEYYTIDGMRVLNPGRGLYIVKRGSKTTKEFIN